ncbi:MAG: hypothetical protein QM702_20420 [Rubrivivax sp.]
MFQRSILLVVFCALMTGSCRKEQPAATTVPNQPVYFSIKDFIRDQWKTFHGQPILLTRYTTLEGRTDSATLSALNMQWSKLFKIFYETDISDPKFLGQYDFETFDEGLTQTRNFIYTARTPELYTQKLQIAADLVTRKIRTIYIETSKQSFWNTRSQKLLYAPMKVLMIHETNDPLIGSVKDLNIEYKFM